MNRLTFFFDVSHVVDVRSAAQPREAARRETLVGEYGEVEDGMQIQVRSLCDARGFEGPWSKRLAAA